MDGLEGLNLEIVFVLRGLGNDLGSPIFFSGAEPNRPVGSKTGLRLDEPFQKGLDLERLCLVNSIRETRNGGRRPSEF